MKWFPIPQANGRPKQHNYFSDDQSVRSYKKKAFIHFSEVYLFWTLRSNGYELMIYHEQIWGEILKVLESYLFQVSNLSIFVSHEIFEISQNFLSEGQRSGIMGSITLMQWHKYWYYSVKF